MTAVQGRTGGSGRLPQGGLPAGSTVTEQPAPPPNLSPTPQVAAKAALFQTTDFYGVDLTPLHAPAAAGYFGQARKGDAFLSSAGCSL